MKPQIKKSSETIAVRILERKGVIRLFGLALVLSPIINIVFALWVRRLEMHQQYTLPIIIKLISSGSVTHHVLTVASLILGIVMLQGSVKAWKAVLVLLGSHILIQIANIGHDLRENWLWGPFFMVNLSIFFFIADQLVFKIRVSKTNSSHVNLKNNLDLEINLENKLKPSKSENFEGQEKVKLKSKILIYFADVGPWAELKSLSELGLHVQCINSAPAGVEDRKIEITFKNGLNLKTQFKNKSDHDFFFEFTTMTVDNRKLLSEWIQKQSA